MKGRAELSARQFDSEVSLAWHTAAFNAATKTKRGLGKLKNYQRRKPERIQSPDQMLEALETLRDMGAPMEIRQVN